QILNRSPSTASIWHRLPKVRRSQNCRPSQMPLAVTVTGSYSIEQATSARGWSAVMSPPTRSRAAQTVSACGCEPLTDRQSTSTVLVGFPDPVPGSMLMVTARVGAFAGSAAWADGCADDCGGA